MQNLYDMRKKCAAVYCDHWLPYFVIFGFYAKPSTHRIMTQD
jgi:hypothetical protein